ncbi:hypothetical protein NN561_013657 [Cricetulus griseus]
MESRVWAASAAEEDAPGSRGERRGRGYAADPELSARRWPAGTRLRRAWVARLGPANPGVEEGFPGASRGSLTEVLCTGECRSFLSSPTTCLRGEATLRLLPGRSPLPSLYF